MTDDWSDPRAYARKRGAMIQVGLIGYGVWGPNLARCLAAVPATVLGAVCDLSAARLAIAHRMHPGVLLERDWRALVRDPRIDAIAIATPAVTHFELGIAALRAGKHVLVEKPFACSCAQALALIEAGERKRLVVMVDHTYLLSPPVHTLHDLLAREQVGEPCHYESARFGSGRACKDVNVIWDLAVHDLAMIDYLLPSTPCGIQATGTKFANLEHAGTLTLFFPNATKAKISVAWHAPAKTRRIQITCSRGRLIFDDLEPIDKIRVFDEAAEKSIDDVPVHRAQESWCPRIEATEPLSNVVQHFAECIVTGGRPLCDALAGLRAVQLLEAADRSLKTTGRLVEVRQKVMAE